VAELDQHHGRGASCVHLAVGPINGMLLSGGAWGASYLHLSVVPVMGGYSVAELVPTRRGEQWWS
jgi:hypothetical protein